MRSVPWLLSELHPEIPSAVFGSRGGGVADDGLHTAPSRWMATAMDAGNAAERREAESRLGSEDPLADALSDRLGFQAQGGDFAFVAAAAGYESVVAVGESMSTAAALWGALEQAERDLGLLAADNAVNPNPTPRIKGLVLTLVPSMGTEREQYWDETMRVLESAYGSVDNATTTLHTDCSIGYGCIPFAKFVAAKHSNLPTPNVCEGSKKQGSNRLFSAATRMNPRTRSRTAARWRTRSARGSTRRAPTKRRSRCGLGS